MDDKLCRACLAPQGKIHFSSIFTENGKIANELYKLTNLVVSIHENVFNCQESNE